MSSIISLRKTSGVTFKFIHNDAESGVKYRVLCRDCPSYPGKFIRQCTGHYIGMFSFKLLPDPVSQFS